MVDQCDALRTEALLSIFADVDVCRLDQIQYNKEFTKVKDNSSLHFIFIEDPVQLRFLANSAGESTLYIHFEVATQNQGHTFKFSLGAC